MRLWILGDLHIEFGPFHAPAVTADVVVLTGDTGVGLAGLEFARKTFGETSIVYVAGNHEFYRHTFPRLLDELRDTASRVGVHFLENDVFVHQGVRFVGCTLWSDFELFGEGSRFECSAIAASRMADYSLIRVPPVYRKLEPRDTRAAHQESRRFLEEELANDFPGKTVVVTHHAPSRRSLPPEHRGDLLSAAFASDMDSLLLEGDIDLWVHGHTHHSVDYRVGPTRVLSNQRGYPNEGAGAFDPSLVVEV